ncbi:MAG: cation diffusion facilitator family transporter [Peptococcaceae bacterium]|nr:cation diffusion facilitator family transporter [Peptococcaceae bacterium]
MLSKALIRIFIGRTAPERLKARERYGLLSGAVGIGVNTLLFVIKLATGLFINSIAFIGDAFNNLTDAASALVTLISFKIASKPADKEHPFGHARVEYIAGLIVSFLVILVGYELFKSSLGRILHPVQVSFSLPALGIVVLALLVKGWLFLFNHTLAREIHSQALLATAWDALSDMFATACIGLSLCASLLTALPLDGYAGLLVAGVILYSGVKLTKDTISPLLGEAPQTSLIQQISKKILSYEEVRGIHDLIVHSYGPGQYMASIHVELAADLGVLAMHEYTDRIERQMAQELGLTLTIHLDPLNPDSAEIQHMQEELTEILQAFPQVLSFHDFRMVGQGETENLLFDLVVHPGMSREEIRQLRQAVADQVRERHPQYFCVISVDQNDMLSYE